MWVVHSKEEYRLSTSQWNKVWHLWHCLKCLSPNTTRVPSFTNDWCKTRYKMPVNNDFDLYLWHCTLAPQSPKLPDTLTMTGLRISMNKKKKILVLLCYSPLHSGSVAFLVWMSEIMNDGCVCVWLFWQPGRQVDCVQPCYWLCSVWLTDRQLAGRACVSSRHAHNVQHVSTEPFSVTQHVLLSSASVLQPQPIKLQKMWNFV